MSTARVITKYPNRRLYDTERSHYITLADIRELILEDVDFAVIDKKTGQDITRTILLQVISELEQHGQAVMSRNFLSQVIHSYGKAAPDVIGEYLEQALSCFLADQPWSQPAMARIGSEPVTAADESAGYEESAGIATQAGADHRKKVG